MLQNSLPNNSIPEKKAVLFSDFNEDFDVVLPPQPETSNITIYRNSYHALEFLKLVELYFKENRSIAYYAARLNISPNYLEKVCKQFLKKAPSKCIEIKLVSEACLLLKDTSLAISEIGFNLGFDDPAYFSRFFKKNIRMTPREYRKMVILYR